MHAATLDDLFKTTFKCPLPHCGESYNNAEEANEHIHFIHKIDDKPVIEFNLESLDEIPLESPNVENTFESTDLLKIEETSFDLEFLNEERSEFIPEFCPDILDQNQNLVSESNPFLSQATNTVSLQSVRKVEPVYEEWGGPSFNFNLESESTSQGAPVEDLGELELQVKNIKDARSKWLTCYSEANKFYHIKSGRDGYVDIKLHYKNIAWNSNGNYFIRSVLVRSNEAFRHFPVDRVCEKHRDTFNGIDREQNEIQPIQALPGCSSDDYNYTHLGARPSLIHKCAQPDLNGNILANIQMIFLCNDSCINSSLSHVFKNAESARDLFLIQTLEMETQGVITILARSKVPVWPKASVCERDLQKTERRKPKGAAAQKLGRLKRMREETNQIERKVIKTEPVVTESTDYHADQLVNAVQNGQLTVMQLEDLIQEKLAAKGFGKK